MMRMTRFVIVLVAAVGTTSRAAEETEPAAPRRPADVMKEADGTDFRFAYYPSLDRLRLLVLAPQQQFEKWELRLSAAGQTAGLAQSSGPLPMPACGATLEVPPLEAGDYELHLSLIAGDGVRREITRTFERRQFPWENVSLGRERVVIPPFTPLVVDEAGSTVACVLRRHQLDGTGLWRQVTSQDRNLLEAPMRLEIQSGGQTHVAAGSALTFTEKAPDRAAGHASWSAGPVRGRTEFDFEYDGLMLLTLHLEPAEAGVDAMQLVIPMKSAETWLMHPVTDLLRHHYAGVIPDGQGKLWEYGGKLREVKYTETGAPDANGKVWDSRHVARWQLPGPFVPYIWLGGPERGICWFAENDRDWSLDPEEPTLVIRRRGAATELIVRLATRPFELIRPRTITMGLMATPAKPMPEVPVNFRRWWAGSMGARTTGTVHFNFMGACYYWGAAGPCFAFYPAFRDFSIYDEFVRVRRTGEVDRGYTDKWLERFQAPEFEPHLETYRAHINWTLNFFAPDGWRSGDAASKTAYAIPYTNARAINWGEEVRTFVDEWSTLDIADPRWPGDERFLREPSGGWTLNSYGKLVTPREFSGVAYAVDPAPSWQDMVLHYHQKMLDTFADGIYFDDYFLVPNYSPFGPGYIDEEGRLRPGVNILRFRELTKRIAVMHHQAGRRPLTFIHMTNTNIVPMLSFGTMLLDHEWRDQGDYAAKDFHERLNLDDDTSLLLAQSTGFQSGCIGVIHDLLRGPERDRFVRSGLGVALTHEMKFPLYWEPLGKTIAEHLSNFGYGLPDCRVFRYWDEPSPVKTDGAAAKTLALSRGGEALIVVAGYGPAGDVTLSLDPARLGLSGELSAVNLETGLPIEQSGHGQFKLPLGRHGFCLVRVFPPEK
ncbi:MAG: DUF6067 family protein [Thermoguttaceae bacterium]|jgi:hypothetical protein|nr:DUF6067 family protein [Thermoguttaceae bacterium]